MDPVYRAGILVASSRVLSSFSVNNGRSGHYVACSGGLGGPPGGWLGQYHSSQLSKAPASAARNTTGRSILVMNVRAMVPSGRVVLLCAYTVL